MTTRKKNKNNDRRALSEDNFDAKTVFGLLSPVIQPSANPPMNISTHVDFAWEEEREREPSGVLTKLSQTNSDLSP